ncbi:malate dehydrogenase [Jiangella alba]|uniref:Malate dehydrogenase n=1 Tax=Jiangella alba TaxID=561176 RepID=A0A1H5PZU5_9ACTN|nr:malate dehydrogenase [Jiangella alba]
MGSAFAFHWLASAPAGDLVLVDVDADAVQAQLMDLQHLRGLGARPGVRIGSTEALAEADVVVVAASLSAPAGPDRAAMVTRNAGLLAGLLPNLRLVRPDALVVVATNPVDAITTLVVDSGSLRAEQVLGLSLNDTLRFRAALAQHFGVEIGRVEGWNLGQHGGAQVPVYSAVSVDGRPRSVAPADRPPIDSYLADWFRSYQELRPGRSTGWASAAGIGRMIDTWWNRRPAPLPCSRVLGGEYGLKGVALGVPVDLSGDRPAVVELRLTGAEEAGLLRAGEAVGRAVRALRDAVARERGDA